MPPRFQQGPPPNPYRFFTPPPRSRRMYGGMPRNMGRPRPFQMQQARFTQPKRAGFLSRLFQGGNRGFETMPRRSVNPFLFGSGVGYQEQTGLMRFLNPESISNFLGQTQQVLRTGQQIGSMVQQYGPLIKNLPALWKLYRGLQSKSDQDEEENTETDLEEEDVASNQGDFDPKEDENNPDRNEEENKISIEEEAKRSLEEDEKLTSQKKITKPEIEAKTDKERKKKQSLQFKSSVPKLYI